MLFSGLVFFIFWGVCVFLFLGGLIFWGFFGVGGFYFINSELLLLKLLKFSGFLCKNVYIVAVNDEHRLSGAV